LIVKKNNMTYIPISEERGFTPHLINVQSSECNFTQYIILIEFLLELLGLYHTKNADNHNGYRRLSNYSCSPLVSMTFLYQ
jgi:hypothetical protein